MKITESQLTKIISETTARVISEAILKERIKGMVREQLESFGDFSQFEASEEDSEEKEDDGKTAEKKPINNPNGTSDMNNETEDEHQLRNEVEAFFDSEKDGRGVDIAPYAYRLYGVEDTKGEDTNDMKNARSKFMKCLHHEPNENGYPYSFTSAEINRLNSFMSSGL